MGINEVLTAPHSPWFPAANNTVRIPLSFTASNRTELIKEADVRGRFGVSFNLDALFVR
jgi:hypothetical protein